MNWIISANSSKYNHDLAFEQKGLINWKQGNISFKVNDIIYVYCAKPIQAIKYKCIVQEINLTSSQITTDEEHWFDKDEYRKALNGLYMKLTLLERIENPKLTFKKLLRNGLNGRIQGPIKLKDELLQYITDSLDNNYKYYYPEIIDENEDVYEGLKTKVLVNKYERSSYARNMCIEYHGTHCSICNINFEKVYGMIGKGFIHVHHIIPVNQI